MRRLSIGLVLLLAACSRRPPIHLESAEVLTGEDVVVTVDRDLDGRAFDRYWVTLQPANASEADVTGRVLVERGQHTIRLKATAPGDYEVRLHDLYPKREHHLVARVPVRIDGYAVLTGAQLDASRP